LLDDCTAGLYTELCHYKRQITALAQPNNSKRKVSPMIDKLFETYAK
jgi:hypothetical protein